MGHYSFFFAIVAIFSIYIYGMSSSSIIRTDFFFMTYQIIIGMTVSLFIRLSTFGLREYKETSTDEYLREQVEKKIYKKMNIN
jgi:hypothetical protein